MISEEKDISYNSTNSYSTLNILSSKTKRVWFVCHGMGYLSRYFIRYFKHLNADENYIIAPQAPSKYYQQPKMHVGSNWLTRDNTAQGITSIMNYFDALFEAENLPQKDKQFIVLGYSQGVSVATRYLARRHIQPDRLILHSGGIPNELMPEDFKYLKTNCKVYLVYGLEDEYLTDKRMIEEKKKASRLFDGKLILAPFEGKHIVNIEFINSLK